MNTPQSISTEDRKAIYPWIVWIVASAFLFYKYLIQVSPSVLIADLVKTFHVGGSSLGNFAAFYFYAYLAMQLPVGILLDRFSPRILMTLAISVCAVGGFVFSGAQYIFTAELGRLLIGVGAAFSAIGTFKLIGIWFPPNRFAFMAGLTFTIGMLGAVFGQAPLAALSSWLSWRDALDVIAWSGVVLAVVFWLVVRDKPGSNQELASAGFAELGQHLRELVKNPQTWFVSIYSGFAFVSLPMLAGFWGVPFLTEKYQVTSGQAGHAISMAFAGFALGAPIGGWFSDWLGRRKPVMIFSTFTSLLLVSFIIYGPAESLFVLGWLCFIWGSCLGFFLVCFAHIREINQPELSATSVGFMNIFNAGSAGTLGWLVGHLIDWLASGTSSSTGTLVVTVSQYQHAFILVPSVMVIALIMQFFVKESYCRQID